jgi:mono/diheme cytochrome c family protein
MHYVVKGVLGIFFLTLLFVGCTKTNDPVTVTEVPVSSGVKGGKLYDKFWDSETGFTGDATIYNKYPNFFRCVSCHGWDLKGYEGANADVAASASQPNLFGSIADIKSEDADTEIFQIIKRSDMRRPPTDTASLRTYDPASFGAGDEMPNYAMILTDAQIHDLVNFIKKEAVDVDQIYDDSVSGDSPNYTVTFSNLGKDGDAALGNAFYTSNCAGCHNADGKKILIDNEMGVGAFIRENPAEGIHKIKFGVLGSPMKNDTLTVQDFKNLYKALSDAVKYPK